MVLNGYDENHSGFMDVFMSKFSPQIGGVESLLYSTFLGGTDQDNSYGIAVDIHKNAYIVGETRSSDFPLVEPFDINVNGLIISRRRARVGGIGISYLGLIPRRGDDVLGGEAPAA